MTVRSRCLAAALLLCLCAAASAPAAEPFYTGLLQDGIEAYRAGDHASAAKSLRLACFGLLEEPAVLARGLTYLALAQGELGDQAVFVKTFERLLEVERRFQAFSQLELEPAVRPVLDAHLQRWIAADVLAREPAFHRAASVTSAMEPEGTDPDHDVSVDPPASSAPDAADAASPATAPPTELAPELQAELNRIRGLIRNGSREELSETLDVARELADQHPRLPEAQHLVAETFYRLSRWQEAVTYFRRGGEPGSSYPDRLFYLSVALFETGDRTAARSALERCLPFLEMTGFVKSYADEILGPERTDGRN